MHARRRSGAAFLVVLGFFGGGGDRSRCPAEGAMMLVRFLERPPPLLKEGRRGPTELVRTLAAEVRREGGVCACVCVRYARAAPLTRHISTHTHSVAASRASAFACPLVPLTHTPYTPHSRSQVLLLSSSQRASPPPPPPVTEPRPPASSHLSPLPRSYHPQERSNHGVGGEFTFQSACPKGVTPDFFSLRAPRSRRTLAPHRAASKGRGGGLAAAQAHKRTGRLAMGNKLK